MSSAFSNQRPDNQKPFRKLHHNTLKDSVRDFYKLNHALQTFDFVVRKRTEFLQFSKVQMSIWNAFDFLSRLIDDTGPDQMQHLLQTSEAIRADGHPDWMVLAGF